ncbi:MAG: YicC/YloC family endoribonuclease [Verrucomicrobiia bacterium]
MPLKSMTGIGRASTEAGGTRLQVEVVTVNRKHFDFVCNLPRECALIEPRLRELALEVIQRGRITMSLSMEHAATPTPGSVLDERMIRYYLKELRRLSKELSLPDNLTLTDLLRLPGVVAPNSGPLLTPGLQRAVEDAVRKALQDLNTMRMREGTALAKVLKTISRRIERRLSSISRGNRAAVEAKRVTLSDKLAGIGLDAANDERVLKEVLVYAERSDIAEEIARAQSHLEQLRSALDSVGPVGRHLEFLVQELGREFHTLGSKTVSIEAAQKILDCKLDIERLREQVQNIE